MQVPYNKSIITDFFRERSGSVVECLTRDRGAGGSSLTGVTALCPWARHINPSLVLVQPRRTRPFITERLLMGRKKSNQTNKNRFLSTFYEAKCGLLCHVNCLLGNSYEIIKPYMLKNAKLSHLCSCDLPFICFEVFTLCSTFFKCSFVWKKLSIVQLES